MALKHLMRSWCAPRALKLPPVLAHREHRGSLSLGRQARERGGTPLEWHLVRMAEVESDPPAAAVMGVHGLVRETWGGRLSSIAA